MTHCDVNTLNASPGKSPYRDKCPRHKAAIYSALISNIYLVFPHLSTIKTVYPAHLGGHPRCALLRTTSKRPLKLFMYSDKRWVTF